MTATGRARGVTEALLDRWATAGLRSLGPVPESVVALLYAAVGAVLLFAGNRIVAAILVVLVAWRGGMAAVLTERDGQPTWVRAFCTVLNLAAEGALIVAGAAWAGRHDGPTAPFAVGFLAFGGAILLSYARTRIRASAGMDLPDGPWGIASREVRLLVLTAGILSDQVYWALVIIAFLGHAAVLGHLARLRLTLRD
jgi:hypothetical protein